MTDAWRCFVAVPIGDVLREALAAATSGWRAAADAPDLRWTDPSGWHLTLAFIGSVPSDRVTDLEPVIAAVAGRHAPFDIVSSGIGAFPRAREARVVWYGLADDEGRFAALAGDATAALGIEAAGPFVPHVTLARARAPRGVDLRAWLAGLTAPDGQLRVDALVLYRSHVGAGPARYEALARAPLARSAVPA